MKNTAINTPDEIDKKAREFFNNLLEKLSEPAKNCDIGYYIRSCYNMINSYRDGITAPISNRIEFLKGKMTEKRGAEYTLAIGFPKDWEIIKKHCDEYKDN